jgi:GGDEF domain-containing protein
MEHTVRLGPIAEAVGGGYRLPYHRVDAPEPVAVVQKGPDHLGRELELAISRRLLADDYRAVVWLGPDAPGAALAESYGAVGELAAAAVWGLKALGGWEEASVTCVVVTEVEHVPQRMRWLTCRARGVELPRRVEVRALAQGWSVVQAAIEEASPVDVALAGLDRTMLFNDANGHLAGDLMLARVFACLEALAEGAGARVVRVAGDQLVLVPRDGQVANLAEAARAAVAGLDIPVSHPILPNHGRITLSLGIAPTRGDVRAALETALVEAKLAGRNVVRSQS